MKILVTGGAGYIGSHVVRQLGEAGHDVVVVDNLSTGHEWAVLSGRLVVADFGDRKAMEGVFAGAGRTPPFDAVMHFAAHLAVGESVAHPLKYYRNNTAGFVPLLDLCAQHAVPHFVFSSSCAVYGFPGGDKRVTERTPLAPISPYGASKMMSERMLVDTAAVSGMRYAILRYFNVAGADPQLRIGQATPDCTQLVKVSCETALGLRPEVRVFGTDYPTRDGTGVRDYIHVEDVSRAHLEALDYLAQGGASEVLNCGYGHGYSVREVIDAVRRASGRPVPTRDVARRPGDPAEVVADSARIRQVLGWQPRHDDLDFIVRTAWDWECRHAGGRRGAG